MKRLFSLLLALIMLVGCSPASPGGGPISQVSKLALREAQIPALPRQPEEPSLGTEAAWDRYMEEYDAYRQQLHQLRGDPDNTDDVDTVVDFAARSWPLAVAGREGQNSIYSPVSLWAALAMLARCADGESREQVLRALGVDNAEQLGQQINQLWRRLSTDDGISTLLLNNSIWLNASMEGTYVEDTLDSLAKDYFADSYQVEMGTQEADRAVTAWIAEQTRGLIGSGDPVVATDELTLALLVSTLYYKSAWTDEFMEHFTDRDTFTCADGTQLTRDFMHKVERSSFLRREGYQAAWLHTRLGDVTFVLPDEGVTPEQLLTDPEFLPGLDWTAEDAHFGEVHWSVPKFDLAGQLDLMDALRAMGITLLTDPEQADLSQLSSMPAFLSGAKQLTRVKVDEQGVEAAAVTILEAAGSAAPPENPEICIMDLERPFLMVIRYAGVPLFVGTVNTL